MSQPLTPTALLNTLVDHRWWIGGFATICVATTAVVTFRQPDLYRARSSILIHQQGPNVADIKEVQASSSEASGFMFTQIKVIESRPVAERVIKRLGLDKNPVFVEGDPDPVEVYHSVVTIQPVRGAAVVEITATLPDRQLVAKIANAHAEEYVRYILEQRFGVTGEAVDWLEKKASELRTHLEKSESDLQKYRVDHSLVSSLQTEEGLLARMRGQLDEKTVELARLDERYLEKHPRVIQAKVEIEELRRNLREKETTVHELRNKSIGYETLMHQATADRQLYDSILMRMKQTDISKSLESSNVAILDRAVEPAEPFSPRRGLLILLSLGVSLLGGAGAVLCLDRMLETVRTEEDLTEYLGLPFLGIIPHMPPTQGERELLDLHLNHPLTAESFRTLASVLTLNEETRELKVLLVTSAVPGEGKSTFALHLAATFASKDLRTLLLEADVRRPTLRERLGLDPHGGLESLAEKNAEASSLLRETAIPNLSVVVSDTAISNPYQFLSSVAVRDFLDHTRRNFDRVVIDAPPIGAVSDALQLASMSDGVLWVARFNSARRALIRDAIARLRKGRCRILGGVINDVDFSKRRTQYDYSGYEAYTSYDAKLAKADEGGVFHRLRRWSGRAPD
ncbi:MAG: GumC family protein [Verrucomicrobiia bacterium]